MHSLSGRHDADFGLGDNELEADFRRAFAARCGSYRTHLDLQDLNVVLESAMYVPSCGFKVSCLHACVLFVRVLTRTVHVASRSARTRTHTHARARAHTHTRRQSVSPNKLLALTTFICVFLAHWLAGCSYDIPRLLQLRSRPIGGTRGTIVGRPHKVDPKQTEADRAWLEAERAYVLKLVGMHFSRLEAMHYATAKAAAVPSTKATDEHVIERGLDIDAVLVSVSE